MPEDTLCVCTGPCNFIFFFLLQFQYKILAGGFLHMCCGYKSTVHKNKSAPESQNDESITNNNPNDYRSSLLVSTVNPRYND